MRFIEFLVEGITSRTSQETPRVKAAINAIGDALANAAESAPDDNWGRIVSEFNSAMSALAGFLDVQEPGEELDWFFPEYFKELHIQPEDQELVQRAMIFLAQRYNERINKTIQTRDFAQTEVGSPSQYYQTMIHNITNRVRSNLGIPNWSREIR